MKNLWFNISIVIILLSFSSFQCGESKKTTANNNTLPQQTISPNNAPDQAYIDSIKNIETLKKGLDSIIKK